MSQLSLTLLYEAILGTKLEKERYNDVATVVKIIKTTKNRSKNILGCAPTSAFFYAFKLGIKQKEESKVPEVIGVIKTFKFIFNKFIILFPSEEVLTFRFST